MNKKGLLDKVLFYFDKDLFTQYFILMLLCV